MRWVQSLLPAVLAMLASTGCSIGHPDLEAGFNSPPPVARPHTWWHWMNGNVTREGITADLEAMKKIGLGGAQIFNVSEGIPKGPIDIMSPQWREMVLFAAQEADRLGLELCMHNCAGWSSSGGPWIAPEHAMQTVVTSEFNVEGPLAFDSTLPQPAARNGFYRDIAVLAFPVPASDSARIKDIKPKSGVEARYGQNPALDAFPADAIIAGDSIIDLGDKLDPEGRLSWNVPAGNWTVLRIGHTCTGAVNAPSPDSGRGLECDKLSRAGLDAHWAGMLGPVGDDLGPLMGRALNNCLIDSYEVGGQNWTEDFAREFARRRHYDLRRWLPVLTGRVVDSGEASERFLWDYRRTIADLFADNYYTYFAELCHKDGMKASIEPYDGPFECLLAGRDADIPMGEFWVGGGESSSCKLAASVAHTYGRTIVGAESFTAAPNVGKWLNHPGSLKAVGDLMYCAGINRYIIHRYAHQPWRDVVPGMTMGQWGTHFERTTTWWEHGGPEWVRYLTRCQYMLQQGRFVADVCYFAGEAAPNNAPHVPDLKAKGYDYDACNADVLRSARVRNGRLVLRDGMSYRVLVLPDSPFMTPETLAVIRDLVRDGATVVGPKPDRSPSLSGYPECDATVRSMAGEVWGDCDGDSVKEHAFGRGRVIWGRPVEEVLAQSGVAPDCEFRGGSGAPKTAWIHRTLGDADIYFVSNQKPRPERLDGSFRITGRAPELWHADSGLIEPAPVWREADGRTLVSIPLEPSGSVFVVFRRSGRGVPHIESVDAQIEGRTLDAPKQIEITRAVYEATDGAGGADVTVKVAELVAAGETSIPANNATFGDPTYLHAKQLRIEYTVDSAPRTQTAPENGVLDLLGEPGPAPPPDYLVSARNGTFELTVFKPGRFTCTFDSVRTSEVIASPLPKAIELTGPWTLRFPPDRGAPPTIALNRLISWTAHPDAGVKYFSGTAEYETSFDIPKSSPMPHEAYFLDLGTVADIAEVTLNGVDLGVMWKPPFACDVTAALKPGTNVLKVRVTNLWVNRLIGDEQLPEDCEWNGITLKEWPKWLMEGAARPTERVTFTTWRHWRRDSQLLESGLIGPVKLRTGVRTVIGE